MKEIERFMKKRGRGGEGEIARLIKMIAIQKMSSKFDNFIGHGNRYTD